MIKKIPKRLKKNPIQEALFEIRFQPTKEVSPSEILPGIFFSYGAEKLGLENIESLMPPIPKELLVQDERLNFIPLVRISGARVGIQIGHQISSISYLAPYEGWEVFRNYIDEFLSILNRIKNKIFMSFSRFSLKYVNLLEGINEITSLDLNITIENYPIQQEKTALAIELSENDCVIILTINSDAIIQVKDNTKRGLLLAIDVIRNLPDNYAHPAKAIEFIEKELDTLHEIEKKWFFKLLRKETVDKLEPEYDG